MEDEQKRIEKMKEKFEEHEAEAVAEHAERVEKARKFNPKDFLAKKIHTVGDEVLGEVRFGDLTLGDTIEVARCKDDQEKGLLVIYLALAKGYPDLKLQDVKEFPLEKGARLIELIGRGQGFLPLKT